MNNKPQFEHDCDACIFLGTYMFYDLYFCPNEPTVVARFGKYGDYRSGLWAKDFHPELKEAYQRAKEKGLIQ